MESWINAIENDNIKDWVHVSNLKFWGEPIAKLYKITQMPTTFVLDESTILFLKVFAMSMIILSALFF